MQILLAYSSQICNLIIAMANRNVNPLEQFAAIQVPAAPVQVPAVPAPDGPKPAVLDLDLDGFVARAMIASNRLVEPGKSLFPNGIDKTFPAMKVSWLPVAVLLVHRV